MHVLAKGTCWRKGKVLLTSMLVALSILFPARAWAADDVLLAAFMDKSSGGTTDYLYVSFDGKTFESIGTPYKPLSKNEIVSRWGQKKYEEWGPDVFTVVDNQYPQNTLHDPAIGYYNGTFWMMSGWTLNGQFIPMFGCSNDLVNWKIPGRPVNSSTSVSPPPDTKGKLPAGQFNCAGPDFMFDDNGDCWVVVPLGYYGDFNGNAHQDYMQPYITKITGMSMGWDGSPNGSSNGYTRINLPVASENWIDPSLYKENGKYYLSIKKDGVTNYVFSINNLNNAGNASAWTVVNSNVCTGYEGPCLTKKGNTYFFYTDKLDDYNNGNPADNGKNGIFVQTSGRIGSGWSTPQRITTVDVNGKAIANRHGSVTRITDPKAIETIKQRRLRAGYSPFVDVYAKKTNYHDKTPHYEEILWLAETGISKGWSDGTFRGMNSVVRQDMAAFLYRLAGEPQYTPTAEDKAKFVDVNANTPHATEIWWLASTGITTGWKVSDNTYEFRGASPVARQDMAAFLHRLYNYLTTGEAIPKPDEPVEPEPVDPDQNQDDNQNDQNNPDNQDDQDQSNNPDNQDDQDQSNNPDNLVITDLGENELPIDTLLDVQVEMQLASVSDDEAPADDEAPVLREDGMVVQSDATADETVTEELEATSEDAEQDAAAGVTFADVHAPDAQGKGGTPHYEDILWLAENNVSTGWKVDGKRYFRGMNFVVRQDMAAFLQRLNNLLPTE